MGSIKHNHCNWDRSSINKDQKPSMSTLKSSSTRERGKKTKRLDDEKEKELMDYLKKRFFLDNFKDAVKEMVDMDPNLTKDPVKYDKALKKKRDKAIENFIKDEFQFFFNAAEYAKVLIDSWRGTYGNCLCGGGVNEPPIPEFLVRDIRPDTPKNVEEKRESTEEIETVEEDEIQEEDWLEEEGGFHKEADLDEVEVLEVEDELPESESSSMEHDIAKNENVVEIDESLPSEDDPCTCIQDYMYPFPPDDYDFPLNIEASK